MSEETDSWLRGQCSRHLYGKCSSLRCLRRGGYITGTLPVNYEIATCEPHEILKELEMLRAKNEQ